MKLFAFLVITFCVLCVTCAIASSSLKRENRLRTARSTSVERQDEDDRLALAQLHLRLMNEAKKQDFSDKDKAEIESILSSIKDRFVNLGDKIKNGLTSFGSKVKNFFQGR